MTTDDSRLVTGRVRSQIIEEAQERAYRALVNYWESRSVAPDQAAIANATRDLHLAVMQYYAALKPLRDDDNIADDWHETTLWEERVPEFQGFDPHGEPVVEQTTDAITFDDLDQYADLVRERRVKKSGFMGTRTVTKLEADWLPASKLLEILEGLDDMAADLGFAPETPDVDPQTEVTGQDIAEIEQKWAGELDAVENVDLDGGGGS